MKTSPASYHSESCQDNALEYRPAITFFVFSHTTIDLKIPSLVCRSAAEQGQQGVDIDIELDAAG